MCLDTLTRKYNKTSGRIHSGYKLFEVEWDDEEFHSSELMFPFFGVAGNPVGLERLVERGKWLQARSSHGNSWEIRCFDSPSTYKPGFHIYENLKDAKRASKELGFTTRVMKVFFRNVTARGLEKCPHYAITTRHNLKVLVAQELYVPKPNKRKVKKRENTRKSRLVSRAGG